MRRRNLSGVCDKCKRFRLGEARTLTLRCGPERTVIVDKNCPGLETYCYARLNNMAIAGLETYCYARLNNMAIVARTSYRAWFGKQKQLWGKS